MVLAYHIVVSAYGFWLPNDPRGSWSDFVAAWGLVRFGKATKVTTRHSLARVEHDIQQRLAAKQALRLPPVQFSGKQALAVAHGFAKAYADAGYVFHACSILPEHVHLVLGRCTRLAERVVGHLKAEATRQLTVEDLHPFAGHLRPDGRLPSPWGEGCWKVFPNSHEQVGAAIRYIEDNPPKEGKSRQKWSFVVPWGTTRCSQASRLNGKEAACE